MLVQRKKRLRYQIQAPLTSLIDIVFMLLIYFLLTTNFMVDEGIKVKLPQAKAAAPQTQQEITVYVDKDGRAFLFKKQMSKVKIMDLVKAAGAGRLCLATEKDF